MPIEAAHNLALIPHPAATPASARPFANGARPAAPGGWPSSGRIPPPPFSSRPPWSPGGPIYTAHRDLSASKINLLGRHVDLYA